jgi:hypothetical protein
MAAPDAGAPPTPPALSEDAVAAIRAFMRESRWAIVSATRRDGTIQSNLMRAGLVTNPLTGAPVVGILLRGHAVKLRLLRRRPQATVAVSNRTRYLTIEGRVTIVGPDDALAGFDMARFEDIRREIGIAQGRAESEDWAGFEDEMNRERRAIVYVSLDRVYGNHVLAP